LYIDKILAIIVLWKLYYSSSLFEKGKRMENYVWETPEEININVAKNVQILRKRKGISQQRLGELSGVSYGSIKRFEKTGNISFLSLTKIAIALDAVNGIKSLFTEVPYQSIDEVINEWKI
jgi:DNA-binding XRE family transcriptional regulator